MGIIFALLGINVIIFVHEMGHMLMARRAGIGIYEFAVGMGPKIVSITRNNTDYTLRLFPLGGFVRLAGLEQEEASIPDEDNFYKKSRKHRFLTLVAGSSMNIIFGFVLFMMLYSIIGIPSLQSRIGHVIPDSPAERAGLMVGDSIQSIDGRVVHDPLRDIIDVFHQSDGSPVSLRVDREHRRHVITVVPIHFDSDTSKRMIGIQLTTKMIRRNPFITWVHAIKMTGYHIRSTFTTIGMLIKKQASVKDMMGPVGIVQLAGSQAMTNFSGFISIMAIISISLGVINLFPFPVLDGGHILLLGIERVRNKRLSQTWENRLNQLAMGVLLLLMATILYQDIRHWNIRADLFQKLP